MATQTVVAVYGVAPGESRVQRLGSGIIPVPELVVVDPPLDARLASDHPPRVLRVALGSRLGEQDSFVELREVSQVLESVTLTGASAAAAAGTSGDRMWALELAEPARSPTVFGAHGPTPPDARPFTAEALAELLRRHQPKRPELSHPPLPPPTHLPPLPPVPASSRPHHHPHGHPATLWCVLFPHASFCRQRA